MTPILITGPGRSGSTLLMAILAQMPQVCVAELIPYEVKLLSYLATAYRTLTAPADHPRSMHPDRLRRDEFSVGFNPFSTTMYNSVFRDKGQVENFFGTFVTQELSRTFANLITEYYSRLAKDQGKIAPLYFAEKSDDISSWPRTFAREAFPLIKEVVLFRDPRDLYCSRKAFFRYDAERAMAEVTYTCHTLVEILEQGGAGLLGVSYESLVQRPTECLRALSVFLGIHVRPLDSGMQRVLFKGHGTSETPQASVGRWQFEMTTHEKAAGQKAWQDFLMRFGYDQDRGSDAPAAVAEPPDQQRD
jgi:hypothetical protein